MNFILNKNFLVYPIVILICGFAILLRAPYLRVPVLVVDESLYAEVANNILDGGIPYRDTWDQKPPGIFYMYALVFSIFGINNLYAIHLTAAFAVAISSLIIFFIARIFGGNVAGMIAALSYSILASAGQASQLQGANTEIFAIMFALGALLLFLKSGFKPHLLFCAGLLLGIAILFKQPTFLMVIPVIILLFLYSGRKSQAFLITVFFFSGLITVLGSVILFFFLNNALYDFYLICYVQNFVYMDGNDLSHGLLTAIKNIPFFIKGNYVFYTTSLLMFFYLSYQLIKKLINKSPVDSGSVFLVSWYLMSFCSVSLGWRFEGHYFFFIFPSVAVLGSLFWTKIIRFLYIKRKLFAVFAGLIFSAGIIYSLTLHCGFPPGFKKVYFTILDPQNPTGQSIRQTAKYIMDNSSKNSRIFVWGLCPEIYTLSNRRCAGRFIYTNYLIGMMTGDKYFYSNTERLDRIIPGSWDKLIDDLIKYKPVFIVDTSPSNYFQYARYPLSRFILLDSLIKKYYSFDRTIGNIDIYRLKENQSL